MAWTGLAIAMGMGWIPATALSADPPDPFVLPGATLAAVTADIDDDGEREVVRLTGTAAVPELEAWDTDDGTWTATFSEELGGFADPGDASNTGAIPLAILRTQVSEGDRVVVLSGRYDPESGMPACCVTVHELLERAGRMELRRMVVPEAIAESAAAVDLDGDGTDEMLLWNAVWHDDATTDTTIQVLRRDGDAWASIASWVEDESWWVMSLVDSDGAPGSDVLASVESGEVSRVAWIDGAITTERGRLRTNGQDAWVVGSVGRSLIVHANRSLGLVRWPHGGEPTVVASHETEGWPQVGVVGHGPDALLLIQEQLDDGSMAPRTDILDMRLEPVGEVPWTPAARKLWELSDRVARSGSSNSARHLWPYFGPMDGDWRGDARSFMSGGMVISAGSGGSFEARPGSSVVGQSVGSAGSDDAWMAIADSWIQTGPVVTLLGGYASEEPKLALVPRAALQDPVAREPLIRAAIEGGIELGRVANTVTMLAAPTGAEIVVTVEPGTVAISSEPSRDLDHGPIDGELRLPVPHPPRPRPDRVYSFERDLLLIGPDGVAWVYRWEGTFAPEAPDLTAWTRAEPLSLEATVAGRAAAGSTVTVDGRAVDLNEFGAYRTTVAAPPWPSTVVIVARDPFGGERRATVEVIGLVDYRGLPWVPIVGVVTVLGGAVLFMRTPRHRPLTQRPVLDDGRLEDLDGDLI